MKLHTLQMKNFMCREDMKEIKFSCEKGHGITALFEKDNSGKSMAARALRWCLYGEDGKGAEETLKKSSDVSVELLFERGEKLFRFYRAVQSHSGDFRETVRLTEIDADCPDAERGTKEEREADEVIRRWFPKSLTRIFLPEGQMRAEDIREAAYVLSGLSAYRLSMQCLKDSGEDSIIGRLQTQTGAQDGSGNSRLKLMESVYDRVSKDFEEGQKRFLNRLNAAIKQNADSVFPEADMSVRLTKNYKICICDKKAGVRHAAEELKQRRLLAELAVAAALADCQWGNWRENPWENPWDYPWDYPQICPQERAVPLVIDGIFMGLSKKSAERAETMLSGISGQVIVVT